MTLIINGDPKKCIAVIRLFLKNKSLFGEEPVPDMKALLRYYDVDLRHNRASFTGQTLHKIELPEIDDIAKIRFIKDFCFIHGIEIEE